MPSMKKQPGINWQSPPRTPGEPASAPREVKWSNRTSEAFFNEDVVAASTFTFKVQRMFFK